jgi:hypothetical protein
MIFDANQQAAIVELLKQCLADGLRAHEKDNLMPMLYEYGFGTE